MAIHEQDQPSAKVQSAFSRARQAAFGVRSPSDQPFLFWLLPIGHAADDDFKTRLSKSITSGVLLAFSFFCVIFLMDADRGAFVHFIDYVVIISAAITLAVLHHTQSLKLTFAMTAIASSVLIVSFLLVVGNRGADMTLAMFFPLLAVVTIGPKASRPWLLYFLCLLVAIYLVQDHLPQITHPLMVAADNPTGSIFYSPSKIPVNRTALGTALIGTAMLYGIIFVAYSSLEASRATIEAQRKELAAAYGRADDLIHTMLPSSVASRLQANPEAKIADHLEEATVLVADIQGFTQLAARLSPEQVVDRLGALFSEFDKLVGASQGEKLKTSGDAYIVVAGLAGPRVTDAAEMVALARKMSKLTAERFADLGIKIRIGIHQGPATAGVLGTSKMFYDIWGDTVNIAARLQSHAKPNAILVSETVAQRTGPISLLTKKQVKLKGKGMMEAFHITP